MSNQRYNSVRITKFSIFTATRYLFMTGFVLISLFYIEHSLAVSPEPTFTPTPVQSDAQTMTFRAYIDGKEDVCIKKNEVWYVHKSLYKPGKYGDANYPTYINGNEWVPRWPNNISDSYEALTPPLPKKEGYFYKIISSKARGSVVLRQNPESSNNYQAIVMIDDTAFTGADWYEFTLAWSTKPYVVEIPNLEPPYIYWKGRMEGVFNVFYSDFQMTIHDNSIDYLCNSGEGVDPILTSFSESLPKKPVNLNPVILKGNVRLDILEQPRVENNYQASLIVRATDVFSGPGIIELAISWKETKPEPTPTPWPTLNPLAPAPTISANPKVLWVVMEGRFYDTSPSLDYNSFRDIFTSMGAKSDTIIVGSEKITYNLLKNYSAVIFADTRTTPPITEPEQSAIVQYVLEGGSIFIIGQQDYDTVQESAAVYSTAIGKLFGVKFSTTISGPYRKFKPHLLLSRVSSLYGTGGSKLLISPPAEALGFGPDGDVILAIANPNYGRVVAFSDEYLFYSSAGGNDLNVLSHKHFATNIAAWLLHKENTEIATMTPIPTAKSTNTPTSTPTFDPYATATPTPNTVNLLSIYPTTLTEGDTDANNARPWEFTVDDIYSLSKFSYFFNKNERLTIDVGPADLGIGHSKDGAVWAIVIPRNNGILTSSLIPKLESIEHIWMRFHPKTINDLFPPETVFNNGNQTLCMTMQRIADYKFRNSFHAGLYATIPPHDTFIFDTDTNDDRRFFYVEDGKLNYASAFEGKSLPDPAPISDDKGAMFDTVWNEFDRNYAMFILRPEVNWDELKTTYRPKAIEAKDQYAFAAVIAEMLKPLRDLHVWYMIGSSYVPIYGEPVSANANYNAYPKIIGSVENLSNDVLWGKTGDNYGFICIYSWTDQNTPSLVDNALVNLKETKGLIVDVRYNGGGSEPLAQQVAGRFADKSYIYAYSRYRNGPNHADLGGYNARSFNPRGSWRYDKPVICLIGRKCMSSNESFAQMMGECPNVTVMGDRTRGSSGNPKVVELPMDMQFSVPQWIDYLVDKTPLDEHGVYPDVWFEPKEGAFAGDRDDLLQAALDRLRGNETRVFDYMLYEYPVLLN